MYSIFDFDTFFSRWHDQRPSVYVISDSALADYKRNQAEAEVIELDKLIEGHEASIERLKKTRALIREEYPALAETKEKDSQ